MYQTVFRMVMRTEVDEKIRITSRWMKIGNTLGAFTSGRGSRLGL